MKLINLGYLTSVKVTGGSLNSLSLPRKGSPNSLPHFLCLINRNYLHNQVLLYYVFGRNYVVFIGNLHTQPYKIKLSRKFTFLCGVFYPSTVPLRWPKSVRPSPQRSLHCWWVDVFNQKVILVLINGRITRTDVTNLGRVTRTLIRTFFKKTSRRTNLHNRRSLSLTKLNRLRTL